MVYDVMLSGGDLREPVEHLIIFFEVSLELQKYIL